MTFTEKYLNIFAVFDTPEDERSHADNAVQAALAIADIAEKAVAETKEGQPPFVINMGINSGVANVGFTAIQSPTQRQRTVSVIGPPVNIAARIAAEARNGAVLIGGGTDDLLTIDIEKTLLGDFEFKNVGQPIRVLRIR